MYPEEGPNTQVVAGEPVVGRRGVRMDNYLRFAPQKRPDW